MYEWRHVTPWHPPILVRMQACDDSMDILIYTWLHVAVRWTLLQAIQLLIMHWSDTKLYLILIICFQLNIQRQLPSTEVYSNNGTICIFKITDTKLIFFFLNGAEGIFSLSNQHILNMAGEYPSICVVNVHAAVFKIYVFSGFLFFIWTILVCRG